MPGWGKGFEVLKREVLCCSLAEVAVGPGCASGLVHISVPLLSVLCPGLSLLVGKQVSHTHPRALWEWARVRGFRDFPILWCSRA